MGRDRTARERSEAAPEHEEKVGSANSTRRPGPNHASGGPDPRTVTVNEAKQRELRAIAQRLEITQARYVYFFDRLTAGR